MQMYVFGTINHEYECVSFVITIEYVHIKLKICLLCISIYNKITLQNFKSYNLTMG